MRDIFPGIEMPGGVGHSRGMTPYYYSATKLPPVPARVEDGILLDLFLNYYAMETDAVRLMREDDFDPGSLQGIFYTSDRDEVFRTVRKIADACGTDPDCRKDVLDTIVDYASMDISGAPHMACLEAVKPLYEELLLDLQ